MLTPQKKKKHTTDEAGKYRSHSGVRFRSARLSPPLPPHAVHRRRQPTYPHIVLEIWFAVAFHPAHQHQPPSTTDAHPAKNDDGRDRQASIPQGRPRSGRLDPLHHRTPRRPSTTATPTHQYVVSRDMVRRNVSRRPPAQTALYDRRPPRKKKDDGRDRLLIASIPQERSVPAGSTHTTPPHPTPSIDDPNTYTLISLQRYVRRFTPSAQTAYNGRCSPCKNGRRSKQAGIDVPQGRPMSSRLGPHHTPTTPHAEKRRRQHTHYFGHNTRCAIS